MTVESADPEVLLDKLRQYAGQEVAILAGSKYFGLAVEGIVGIDDGKIYIDKKIPGQERHRMDITNSLRRCNKLDVRPVV